MKFGIIAAGKGSRLAQEGVLQPKPLVNLNGTAMIDRLIRIFMENDATSIAIIINEEQVETRKHLTELQKKYPLEIVVKSTQGSLHSFYELMPSLKGEKFCLTTVDTVFNELEFIPFIENFKFSVEDGLMAVTDYIDDEKPLYISTDEMLNITGYHDSKVSDSNYISGGVYCLTPSCLDILQDCMNKGMTRMREFQSAMVEKGKKLKAYRFHKILDVDHAEDIAKAENFINQAFPIVGISRSDKFSPNKTSSDAQIFNQVRKNLEIKGFSIKVYTEQQFIDQPMYAPTIFTMAREEHLLDMLDIAENAGAIIVNSPKGIRNAGRLQMTNKLLQADIPSPKIAILFSERKIDEQTDFSYPFWIKRADNHAQTKDDVSFVQSKQEADQVLQKFNERGIKLAIATEHLEGDLIKFYGVTGTDFFYWYYPSHIVNSKFGLEVINGEAKGYLFSEETLKKYCEIASNTMNISIYGGDCVISSDGEIKMIDFNDWPSFAPCCDAAAKAIAELIIKRIENGK